MGETDPTNSPDPPRSHHLALFSFGTFLAVLAAASMCAGAGLVLAGLFGR